MIKLNMRNNQAQNSNKMQKINNQMKMILD